jgi:hypothetical protein
MALRVQAAIEHAEAALQHSVNELKLEQQRGAVIRLERVLAKAAAAQARARFMRWCAVVRSANEERMVADRKRWWLHASGNSTNDLQAWYHATFYTEVYRLKVSELNCNFNIQCLYS